MEESGWVRPPQPRSFSQDPDSLSSVYNRFDMFKRTASQAISLSAVEQKGDALLEPSAEAPADVMPDEALFKKPRSAADHHQVKLWLDSLTQAVRLARERKWDEIKFPHAPTREAAVDYLNAQQLTQDQADQFVQLCQAAPDHIRPFVDPTHPKFDQQVFYQGKVPNYVGPQDVEPGFAQRYKDIVNIWRWLVQRALNVLWDKQESTLEFIFQALMRVCGASAVENMVLWERALVSPGQRKTLFWRSPQLAVAHTFFSAVFNTGMQFSRAHSAVPVYTYIACVVCHNTQQNNAMDVNFGDHVLFDDVFARQDVTVPVKVAEIKFVTLNETIDKELQSLSQ